VTSETVFYELKGCYTDFEKKKSESCFLQLLQKIEKHAKEVFIEPAASSSSKS